MTGTGRVDRTSCSPTTFKPRVWQGGARTGAQRTLVREHRKRSANASANAARRVDRTLCLRTGSVAPTPLDWRIERCGDPKRKKATHCCVASLLTTFKPRDWQGGARTGAQRTHVREHRKRSANAARRVDRTLFPPKRKKATHCCVAFLRNSLKRSHLRSAEAARREDRSVRLYVRTAALKPTKDQRK